MTALTDEIGATSAQTVAFAHEYGLQTVELRYKPGTNKEYVTLRDADIQADVTNLLNDGIKISCLNAGLRLDDPTRAVRCAQLAGADKLRIFTGARVADPAAELPRIATLIAGIAAEAEKQKLTLLIENHPESNVSTGAEMAALMKLTPSKSVAIEWAPRVADDFPQGYALLPKKRIQHVRAVLKPGVAQLDWKAILLALDRDGFSGRLGLETGEPGSASAAAAHTSMDELQHVVREVS